MQTSLVTNVTISILIAEIHISALFQAKQNCKKGLGETLTSNAVNDDDG